VKNAGSSRLLEAMKGRVLLGDGAMGTQLQQAGLEGGGEAWNVDHPERVLAIQRGYAEAGSDCIITNTFGACRIMLERHGQADRVAAINEAGARIAREALGPRGVMAQPNAGQPVLEDFKVVCHETPEQMAAALPDLLVAGAAIVGGCRGSTPAHIRRFRDILDGSRA
jgi:methionine synthase I (cobalamin-dependent)